MNGEPPPPAGSAGEFILYQTEDGRTRIECRFDHDTLWLTQLQLAELFQTSVPNINLHLKAIFAEGELSESATVKSYLTVRAEGAREVRRNLAHYSLPVVLAGGYRMKSRRTTHFRSRATGRTARKFSHFPHCAKVNPPLPAPQQSRPASDGGRRKVVSALRNRAALFLPTFLACAR